MIKKNFTLLGLLIWQFIAYAQNPFGAGENSGTLKLYVSKQTGEFTSIQGTYNKVADEFEDGTCTITSTGPIVYTIDPAPNYGPSSNTTWTGLVKPDVANCPAPGTTTSATLTGDYNVHYSKPGSHSGVQRTCNGYYVGIDGTAHDPHGCGGTHTIVPDAGSVAINYEVISILITLPKEFQCKGGELTLNAETVYPEGGYYLWDTPSGQISGPSATINVDPILDAGKTITVTYTVEGVTYKASAKIKFNKLISIDPPVCVKEETKLQDIANDKYDGNCHPAAVFTPATLAQNWLVQTSDIPVSVAAGGVVLNDVVVMVNESKILNANYITFNFDLAGTIDAACDAIFGMTKACSKSGSLKPKGGISEGSFKLCCPDDGGVIDGTKWSGAVSWESGIKCKFPILGCPYVASLDAVVSVGAGLTISIDRSTTCSAANICAQVSGGGKIGGGIGFTFAGGVISGDLMLVVNGLGLEGKYCFTPAPAGGQVVLTYGAGSVVGTIETLWGLTSHSVDYPLWSGFTSPPIEF